MRLAPPSCWILPPAAAARWLSCLAEPLEANLFQLPPYCSRNPWRANPTRNAASPQTPGWGAVAHSGLPPPPSSCVSSRSRTGWGHLCSSVRASSIPSAGECSAITASNCVFSGLLRWRWQSQSRQRTSRCYFGQSAGRSDWWCWQPPCLPWHYQWEWAPRSQRTCWANTATKREMAAP